MYRYSRIEYFSILVVNFLPFMSKLFGSALSGLGILPVEGPPSRTSESNDRIERSS